MSRNATFRQINALLETVNVRLADAEAHAAEQARLHAFEAAGGLERPAYALSPGLAEFDIGPMCAALGAFGPDLTRLMTEGSEITGYSPGNGYFDTPDAEALYLMYRRMRPRRIVEIGCGNSTRIARQAILDGGWQAELTAIDPWPRTDIVHVVDRFEQATLESVDPAVFDALQAGDLLFIDSSHQVRVSNDVAHLFCRIIPSLASGVVIHVHDVFLPYEYPKRFFYDCPSWGEQYVLHALLQSGGYEILWPGHYLQRARPDAVTALPFLGTGRAQSFWIAKK